MHTGHCHCGTIRYSISGKMAYSGLCHCSDCRRHSGAPMVAWAAFPENSLTILQGTPKIYHSSENGRRHFCADCGTGLFYYNSSMLPGIVDIQTTTLDDPNSIAPQLHVQTAEKLEWMKGISELPEFERYPSAK